MLISGNQKRKIEQNKWNQEGHVWEGWGNGESYTKGLMHEWDKKANVAGILSCA